MVQKENITGIVLAGGKSSRMGLDKGFLELNDKTFMANIIEALKPLVNTILIVSNNADYDVFKLERVTDFIKDSGPLAGLYSGLSHSKTEYNLVLSCDVPLINTSILNILVKESDTNTDVVQIESEGRAMPLIALYNKRCEAALLTQLQNGERRLLVAIASLQVKTIKLPEELKKYTRNINTPSELKEIKDEFDN